MKPKQASWSGLTSMCLMLFPLNTRGTIVGRNRQKDIQYLPALMPAASYEFIVTFKCLKQMLEGAGKVAQQLGALVALAEDLVSVPSAHRMAHIHL